jgi:Cu2+-containing amine oxidase
MYTLCNVITVTVSADIPLLRHYSSAYKFYGAVPGAQLVVRMISTVYNYDYIQDLHLGVDGTLDVKVTTSGYIQATTFRSFYPQHYAFPISSNVSGGQLLSQQTHPLIGQ